MFKCVPNLFKVVQMCSNVFQHCSNVFKYVQNLFKCVLMCSIVLKCVCTLFKCVQICSNMFKNCSNVLNCVQNLFKCFWTLFKCVQMISYVFKCVQVMVMGGLWVAKVGFGRLKVVIGGYEWLSGFVFGSCLENAILTTSPPYKMSLPDKTSILTKRPSWQNVHPGKMSILIKHTFVTKRLLTFSQHKSRALIHGRNSAIQIIHASGTPICLVNIISVYFQKNTGFKSN